MKVIFLDVDGVLNTYPTRCDYPKNSQGYIGIDPQKVELLAELVRATDAEIVLSSTWRLYRDLFDDVDTALVPYNIEILDATKDLQGPRSWAPLNLRGMEVEEWLSRNPQVTGCVILDDIDEFQGWLHPFFLQTDYYGEGLTRDHIHAAIHIFQLSDAIQRLTKERGVLCEEN